ncbi:MAG TPA: 4-alpha-glucanotransferase [Candidatus Dormibacteraeota bacterium]|nr:4-alpha-glucanotransferase [Candidatus Dormibacteraeota bacterium]
MVDRGARWGILPSYFGWQGDLVETPHATSEAILAAMGATQDRPPRVRRPTLPDEPCAPPPKRAWGWAIQLYALRSRESWGIGDLADLRRFGRWSRRHGASILLLNPLGAQTPTLPYQPSPYYSSSRRFRNFLYLRIDEIEGAEQCAAELEPLREAALNLNQERLIDYDQVFELKTKALDCIFQVAPEPPGLTAWVRGQGSALRDFATFNALAEVHGPAWRDWPTELRHPRSGGMEASRSEHAARIAFHQWLQFHIDRQLARASKEIGLVTDVPVGFASDGFDAWRWQELLAPGVRVGAPPDEFFRDGQDWGLPAFNPWKLGEAHWEPFVEAIRSAARHAAGVRLDHVMGLFRLFWIPDGMTAAQGAYVRYPAATLLALLANESRRAGAFVVGEDLGLVPPTVRKHLRRRGSLSYRLLWFEGSEPMAWPRDAVAAVGTHDLPTVAGIWTRSEPEHRLHHLREKLVSMTGLPDETPPVGVAVAAYAALALGRPRIVLASLEDALGVNERPNVPGTTTEFPNWRLALPSSIEDVENADGVNRIASAMNAAGRSANVSRA